MARFVCCDSKRRQDVQSSASLNGIDFLEVDDAPGAPQRLLRVHFLKQPAPTGIGPSNLRITGGERITGVGVDPLQPPFYEGDVLVVQVDQAGDFSPYWLALVDKDGSGAQLPGLDPLLAAVEFSFKVTCPSDFDCQTTNACAPTPPEHPEFSYLAKDYASFRQLMLDRLAQVAPNWRERNPADLGITLVELLAYIGDRLSYYQDAIGTEAYLRTARLRTSVRRHARLVDYFMHEGCAARAWVHAEVSADSVAIPARTQFLAGVAGADAVIAPASAEYAQALANRPLIFESLAPALLFQAHNSISFYAWGDRQCCLPVGTTRASLLGHLTNLRVGDVLVLEEIIGPRTGNPADADPSHRQAVRLVAVSTLDVRGQPLVDPLYDRPVTEVEWAAADALAFPLCVSSRIEQGNQEIDLTDVCVARGNLVLVDHGQTVGPEPLGAVPAPTLFRVPAAAHCSNLAAVPVPPRFGPQLSRAPLTFSVPFSTSDLSSAASALSRPNPAQALPAITQLSSKTGQSPAVDWFVQRDLLNSEANATDVVVETDASGAASLRFGDDQHGLRPATGAAFQATYRVGNGSLGNVGAGAIGHVVTIERAVTSVRNPLPAMGGSDPESLDTVRRNAPYAFRTQERAVTGADYAQISERVPEVERAAASFRWTGSWHRVFVAVEESGAATVSDITKQKVRELLDRYRLIGHDVEVEAPLPVSLEMGLRVSAAPDHFRADIAQELLKVFSNRRLPGGRRGVFHPDNFRLGEPVYLSPFYAAAMGIEGVTAATITSFQRQGKPNTSALSTGVLDIGRLEVAQLDNDPNFRERGVFKLVVEGGK